MSEIYSKNSEILFIYDAKLCNPNGDPDDENKPRMDYETRKNLVSDVRLKRYIRDYLESIGYDVFVAKIEGKSVSATERLKKFFEKENKSVKIDKLEKSDIDFLLSKLVDVRFFGATMPIKAQEGEKGAATNFIGPIQFNWGYSLNKVDIVESSSITSTFSGKEEKGEYGTFGKDWRVYYSIISFYGIISGYRARWTNLTFEDVDLFDRALINSIPKIASTRSKIGQAPRFYIRIEYKTSETFFGDLRDFAKIDKEEGLRDIQDFELDLNLLKNLILENKEKIEKIFVFEDRELKIKGGSFKDTIKKDFEGVIVL
ncbi:MAG TPA: type I-B CRISPR-associated protein Cas7/Csh2 [Caldisericia bacterium]|nr:type I-B CRISPR-associated protein Cas7/Csh2 [Caldisericia bacterium]